MAEISQNEPGNPKGRVRSKKQSTRIDMTPMVDLAFLLLTFFILTTNFIKPTVMDLAMPDNTGPQSPVSEKNILNVVLAENNKVYWWDGLNGNVTTTNYSIHGLREVLLSHRRSNSNVMVLIKPTDRSKYENLVDALDEITIANIERYAIVDFASEDEDVIRKKEVLAKTGN